MKSNRCIDATIHDLTAAQALEELLRHFKESKREQVTVFCRRGDGKDFMQQVRTELSRVRKSYKDNDLPVPYFGFEITGPFYIHADGIPKEGFAIHYRITKLQQMKNFAQRMELT